MLERLLALEHTGIKLGLENIGRLCRALGHPERTFIPVHIAGTNGKGSVTAMVHAGLRRAGIRAARYTSPHLTSLNERFVIGDAPVDPRILDTVGNEVLDLAERLVRQGELDATPTFFEVTTAIGFELFRRSGVEVAVIEVGLGGRFDATNVVQPRVGAITSIGLDHQQYLGNTIEAIAFEKAGILKPGMTVFTGEMPAEALRVIREVAAERDATVIEAASGAHADSRVDQGVATVTVTTPDGRIGPVPLGLRGAHQVGNAVVAIRILQALRRSYPLDVPDQAIGQGVQEVRWPARLEMVSWPDGGRRAIIDAAHNPDGAGTLAAYLSAWHPTRPPLVVGLMRDKDAEGILRLILPVTGVVIATAAPTPRAMPADELAALVRRLDPSRPVEAEADPWRAVERAFAHGDTICVGGSIFLAGAVRDALRQRAILP